MWRNKSERIIFVRYFVLSFKSILNVFRWRLPRHLINFVTRFSQKLNHLCGKILFFTFQLTFSYRKFSSLPSWLCHRYCDTPVYYPFENKRQISTRRRTLGVSLARGWILLSNLWTLNDARLREIKFFVEAKFNRKIGFLTTKEHENYRGSAGIID